MLAEKSSGPVASIRGGQPSALSRGLGVLRVWEFRV